MCTLVCLLLGSINTNSPLPIEKKNTGQMILRLDSLPFKGLVLPLGASFKAASGPQCQPLSRKNSKVSQIPRECNFDLKEED